MPVAETQIDLERLLKLRLIVGRFGEMDLHRWWNCRSVLGRQGEFVFSRGFPATHGFARAHVVFAIARARCNELFSPPGCMTLWNLPAELEDQFEDRWQGWLDQAEAWAPFFQKLAGMAGEDLLQALFDFELITPAHRDAVSKLRRSAEGRAVPLPGVFCPDDETLLMLAAGFARSEPGKPAIPYARLEGVT